MLSEKELELTHNIIKKNVVKTIDSNVVTLHNSSFRTKRTLDSKIYNTFPQATFNDLVHLLKNGFKEGAIEAYENDSLTRKLTRRKAWRNYFAHPEMIPVFNEYGNVIVGLVDTVFSDGACNSISLSENILFKTVSDSLTLIPYVPTYIYEYDKPLSLLTVEFSYKAIGLDYYHYMNEKNYNIKTIWLDYNEVKELLIKRKVNFDVYESIFTKNLFDIFQIEHESWQKSNYKNKH
jgi:hypothetical protein